MRKTVWFGLALLLTLLLGACAQQTAVSPTDTVAAATDTVAAATETTTSNPTEGSTTAAPVEAAVTETGPATCQPYNLLDQILAAPDPNLAPVTDEDWVEGPADAKITLLEFSDFQ
jgi:ABC-type transport system substrate-binding protein